MFTYIAPVLSALAESFGGLEPHALDSPNRRALSSCRRLGIIGVDPKVQLRVTGMHEDEVRIFGFPPPEDLPRGDPYLYLQRPLVQYLHRPSPAHISYTMGDDWRLKLRDDARLPNDQVILRASQSSPDEDDTLPATEEDIVAEERAHCLRMRRCGAIGINQANDLDVGIGLEIERRGSDQIFGWPAGGGVWILRRPTARENSKEARSRVTDDDRKASAWEYSERYERYANAVEDAMQQLSMEDLCGVLEKAGAQFYETIADCPEAVALDLVELKDLE